MYELLLGHETTNVTGRWKTAGCLLYGPTRITRPVNGFVILKRLGLLNRSANYVSLKGSTARDAVKVHGVERTPVKVVTHPHGEEDGDQSVDRRTDAHVGWEKE